jgi:hypothetical protein
VKLVSPDTICYDVICILREYNLAQFVNNPGLDFADASEGKAVETINLVVQKEGVEYAVR